MFVKTFFQYSAAIHSYMQLMRKQIAVEEVFMERLTGRPTERLGNSLRQQ